IEVLTSELTAPLGPGKEMTLGSVSAGPPLEVTDRIVAYGTLQDQPVPWKLFTSPADERARVRGKLGTRGEDSPLFQMLDDFLSGTRGASKKKTAVQEAPWTRSIAEVIVRARGEFAEPA